MDPVVALLLGGLLVWIIYDYVRHYLKRCPTCKGTGTLRATFWSKQYRPCPRCNRSGEVRHSFAPKD